MVVVVVVMVGGCVMVIVMLVGVVIVAGVAFELEGGEESLVCNRGSESQP